jgi:predicted N-acetyltransferase YhbS
MEKGNAVYLQSLAVLPVYEGMGIATEFMQMIITDAKHQGYTAIYSHAHEGASAHLHEKFGGKELLRREDWYGTGATHILYKIDL